MLPKSAKRFLPPNAARCAVAGRHHTNEYMREQRQEMSCLSVPVPVSTQGEGEERENMPQMAFPVHKAAVMVSVDKKAGYIWLVGR